MHCYLHLTLCIELWLTSLLWKESIWILWDHKSQRLRFKHPSHLVSWLTRGSSSEGLQHHYIIPYMYIILIPQYIYHISWYMCHGTIYARSSHHKIFIWTQIEERRKKVGGYLLMFNRNHLIIIFSCHHILSYHQFIVIIWSSYLRYVSWDTGEVGEGGRWQDWWGARLSWESSSSWWRW